LVLSLKKLTKSPIIDKIADRLLGWKADLLARAGPRILVWSVLTLIMVYLAMAMEILSWAIKVIDRIERSFLW
jgi:hypothetical protein